MNLMKIVFFLKDSIVFPKYIYITDDGKEFNDFGEASEHQKLLFPLQEVTIERENNTENLAEGEESEIKIETIFLEPTHIPDVLIKEIFILPDNCTWEPAPSPANDATWNGKRWINGETPEMIPPQPSQAELLVKEIEVAKQDNVELREILLDIITESLE
ncbi:hypothetical protein PCORN_10582 [Listeria cornellensis FSL F6-0969]|uniref:Uncharacterized protein n=2 Tax=Listeria cornellensis TaxID=1494961 RepID=W7BV23_9LIST|nr:hypothetical protein PCORN_10582 [Listeria cornellensis FSL F6-0969]